SSRTVIFGEFDCAHEEREESQYFKTLRFKTKGKAGNMMSQNLLKSFAISIGIGSFIYLLNGVFGPLNEIQPQEIISVWIASALIGIASSLYYTKISELLVAVIQFGVGIT